MLTVTRSRMSAILARLPPYSGIMLSTSSTSAPSATRRRAIAEPIRPNAAGDHHPGVAKSAQTANQNGTSPLPRRCRQSRPPCPAEYNLLTEISLSCRRRRPVEPARLDATPLWATSQNDRPGGLFRTLRREASVVCRNRWLCSRCCSPAAAERRRLPRKRSCLSCRPVAHDIDYRPIEIDDPRDPHCTVDTAVRVRRIRGRVEPARDDELRARQPSRRIRA